MGDEMLMSYRAVSPDRAVIRPLHWSIAAAGGVVGLDHCVRSATQWYHSATSGYLHFLTLTAIYEPSSLWAWIYTAYLLFAPMSGILLVTGALAALVRLLRGREGSPLSLPEQLLLRGSGIAAGLTILLSLQSLYHAAGGITWTLRGGSVPDLSGWQPFAHLLNGLAAGVAPLLIFVLLLDRRRRFRRGGASSSAGDTAES